MTHYSETLKRNGVIYIPADLVVRNDNDKQMFDEIESRFQTVMKKAADKLAPKAEANDLLYSIVSDEVNEKMQPTEEYIEYLDFLERVNKYLEEKLVSLGVFQWCSIPEMVQVYSYIRRKGSKSKPTAVHTDSMKIVGYDKFVPVREPMIEPAIELPYYTIHFHLNKVLKGKTSVLEYVLGSHSANNVNPSQQECSKYEKLFEEIKYQIEKYGIHVHDWLTFHRSTKHKGKDPRYSLEIRCFAALMLSPDYGPSMGPFDILNVKYKDSCDVLKECWDNFLRIFNRLKSTKLEFSERELSLRGEIVVESAQWMFLFDSLFHSKENGWTLTIKKQAEKIVKALQKEFFSNWKENKKANGIDDTQAVLDGCQILSVKNLELSNKPKVKEMVKVFKRESEKATKSATIPMNEYYDQEIWDTVMSGKLEEYVLDFEENDEEDRDSDKFAHITKLVTYATLIFNVYGPQGPGNAVPVFEAIAAVNWIKAVTVRFAPHKSNRVKDLIEVGYLLTHVIFSLSCYGKVSLDGKYFKSIRQALSMVAQSVAVYDTELLCEIAMCFKIFKEYGYAQYLMDFNMKFLKRNPDELASYLGKNVEYGNETLSTYVHKLYCLILGHAIVKPVSDISIRDNTFELYRCFITDMKKFPTDSESSDSESSDLDDEINNQGKSNNKRPPDGELDSDRLNKIPNVTEGPSYEDTLEDISSQLGLVQEVQRSSAISESEDDIVRRNDEVLRYGFPDGADVTFQNPELRTLNGTHDAPLNIVNPELLHTHFDSTLNVDIDNMDYLHDVDVSESPGFQNDDISDGQHEYLPEAPGAEQSIFLPTTVSEVFNHFTAVIEDLKEDIKRLQSQQVSFAEGTKCTKPVEAMLRKISKSGRSEYTWDLRRASSFNSEKNMEVTRNIIKALGEPNATHLYGAAWMYLRSYFKGRKHSATHTINEKKSLKKKNWRRTRIKRKKDKSKRRVKQVKKLEESNLQYPFKNKIADYRALEEALLDIDVHSSCVSDIDTSSDVSSGEDSAKEDETPIDKELRLADKTAARIRHKTMKKRTLVIPAWRPTILTNIICTLDRLHLGVNADARRSAFSETRDSRRILDIKTRQKLLTAVPSLRRTNQ